MPVQKTVGHLKPERRRNYFQMNCVKTMDFIWYSIHAITRLSCNNNDNDNENNFIVMNYIGTMTAVNWTQQIVISILHLDFGIVFWNSWQKGMEPRRIGPNICFHHLLWDAGKQLIGTNYKLTHWGPAWQVSSRYIEISGLLLPNAFFTWWLRADLNELIVMQLKTRYCIYIIQQYGFKNPNGAYLWN